MPRIKYCNHRGCTNLTKPNERYCTEHKPKLTPDKLYRTNSQRKLITNQYQKQYNRTNRDEQADEFYHSSQWKQVRQFIVARDMNIYQVCGNVNTDRKIVDHIHRLKSSSDEKLDHDNLWTLCYDCHSIKTRLEQSIENKPNGNNILKHATKTWWTNAIKNQKKKAK